MTAQKPPNPVGERTAFPWQTRWETFAPEWESLYDPGSDHAVTAFEYFRHELEDAGRETGKFSRATVAEIIGQAQPQPKDRERLTDRLYHIGAAYMVPKLKAALKLSSHDIKNQAEKIARLADELTDTLASTDLDAMWFYFIEQQFSQLLESSVDAFEPVPDQSAFPNLLRGLVDLAEGARVLAGEVPIFRPGSTVPVLQRRLIRDAAVQLKDAGLGPLILSVSDPRKAISSGAQTLLDFLDLLLSPNFSRQTIYKVLAEYGLHTTRKRGRPLKGKIPR